MRRGLQRGMRTPIAASRDAKVSTAIEWHRSVQMRWPNRICAGSLLSTSRLSFAHLVLIEAPAIIANFNILRDEFGFDNRQFQHARDTSDLVGVVRQVAS